MCMYLPLLEEERLDYSISFSIFLCFASASGTQHFLLQQIVLAYLPQRTLGTKKIKQFMRWLWQQPTTQSQIEFQFALP